MNLDEQIEHVEEMKCSEVIESFGGFVFSSEIKVKKCENIGVTPLKMWNASRVRKK